ncbi:CheR family methyltransferase [Oscillibacter ruminantium]|jgi:chemotaxis protein methyltransferase CheR|uniref:CheR family methyltransferase n=1 Tax=Oscillibacter ruminantium TaxID=1263547 RepID=UPI0002FB81C2|nr:protein-glutamate O-methyltransferase CheR [Oscillibacter ruminantium]MDN0032092.1 protein-glutamate O-methyltransferase CheR [Oscillibacter valericigenes]MEA5041216.1 protein-glutamate O-methyltransferase CheR [Oscillibacter ruminantium]
MGETELKNGESSFAPLAITDKDFHRLVNFIQQHYGIDLSKKQQLISGRLSYTIKSKGYDSFGPFIDHLLQKQDPADVELVLNKLTTNYTFFMREQEHFNFFRNTILPDIVQRHQKDKSLSIWSAGCASGEEPYTISMYIKEFLGPEAGKWDTRVLATDISQQALTKAQTGTYNLPDTIPPTWKSKFFIPSGAEGQFQVAPVIRDNVIFRTFNLMDPIRFRLKFDVIFCRNVMIYFNQQTKDELVARFCEATEPGGYLLIGHSETMGRNPGYRYLAPATFQKR